ncbi:MAG: glycosyltransferase [Acidobacteria bacterium]|nr:glycosyltransferase [Acidobacteriota bacterium]
MIFVFYFLAAVLILLSWKSYAGGVEYLRFFRRELGRGPSNYAPFATVFVPCRGLDDGLEENLAPLMSQAYPDYEVVFVVDSVNDEAVPVIGRFLKGGRAKMVVAGKTEGESQKVHNLRQAVLQASERSEVFVFADSDVRPANDWMRALVGPLEDDAIGCASGYRWFISEPRGFASELRSVWNASIASALGPNMKGNFCWGGSMAIRRSTFERVEMRERWRGTLSDDFAMTRAMNDNELAIAFVPRALSASVEGCGFRECLEFTTRQMKITRVYRSHLWKLTLVGSALFCGVMIWAAVLLFVQPVGSLAWLGALVTLLSVSILSIGKSVYRMLAVSLVLTEHAAPIRRQWPAQCTLWLLSPALFFFNSVCALLSRRILWRGIRYELRSPNETIVIGDPK